MSVLKTSFGVVTLVAFGIGIFEIGHTLPKLIQTYPSAETQSSPGVRTVQWSPGKVSPLRTLSHGSSANRGSGSPAPSLATGSTVNATSLNWAGIVQQGNAETSVQATWTVPKFAATSASNPNSAVAEWIGLGGMQANALIQIGTITTPNASGQATTTVFWENLPGSAVQVATVATGSKVSANIQPSGPDQWRLELSMAGQKRPIIDKVVSLTKAQAAAIKQSADWITEAPTTSQGVAPLAPVSATTMAGIKANGVPLAKMNPSTLQSIGLYSQSGQLMAAPASDPSNNSVTVNTVYGSLPATSSSPGESNGGGTLVIQQPGYGNGYGYGFGNGYGNGYGNAYGDGYGNGGGTLAIQQPGYGNGYGGGYGNGFSIPQPQSSISWSITF